MKNLRQKMNAQRKKNIKCEYRQLMWIVKETIYGSLDKEAYIEFKKDYKFIVWLIAKKLERKGYRCELKEGFESLLNIGLEIRW